MIGGERDAVDSAITFRPAESGSTEVAFVLEGAVVSRAYIIPMTIRVGAALVRMDGIGGVGTDEACRNRGYSRRVLAAAVRRMRGGDAALSTLYGIPDYYPRFGFAAAGPEHSLALPLVADSPAAELPNGWSVRPFIPDDLPAVRGLYAAATARAVGPLPREGESRAWGRLIETPDDVNEDGCRVVLDETGRPRAYLWLGRGAWWMDDWARDAQDSLLLAEVVADGGEAADAVLAAADAWAREWGEKYRRLELALPPEGTVATAAMLRGARTVRQYARTGEFMARTLDPARLLAALLPELSLRVRGARLPLPKGLRVETDEGAVSLDVTDGVVALADGVADVSGEARVLRLHQSDLARLALGGYPPRELLARLPDPPDEPTVDLAAALFPQRHPHIYPVDRF